MRGCSSTWCASGVAALTSAFLLWGVLACDARPFDPALVVLPAFLLAGLPPSEDRIGDCPSARALVGEACLERSGLAATLPRLLDCPDGGFDVRVEDAFAGAEGAVLRSGEAGSPRLGAADAREGAVLRSGEAGSPRLGAADAREGAFEAIGGSCCDRLARAVTCEPVVSMWGGWRGRSDPHQAAPPRERAARAAGQHAAHARTHVSHTHAHTAPLRTHSAAVASRRQCAGRSPWPVLWRSRAKPELRTCNPPGLHGRSPSRVRWPRTPQVRG